MSHSHIIRSNLPPLTPMRAILALMLREMSSTYGDSPGGYVWAIIQPIGMIVILSLGFSLLVRTPSLGTSFVLFYATGFLTFDMYTQIMRKVSESLKYSKAMLAYPRVIWLDAIIARIILNVLTSTTVFSIIISIILFAISTRTVISIQPVLTGLAMAACLGTGVGLMNCLLSGLFPVWKIAWKILMRPMFIASGVLFIYEDMPPLVQDILWWNPVLHATGILRVGFYPNYYASYVSQGYVFGISLGLTAFGLLFLRKYHEKILNR